MSGVFRFPWLLLANFALQANSSLFRALLGYDLTRQFEVDESLRNTATAAPLVTTNFDISLVAGSSAASIPATIAALFERIGSLANFIALSLKGYAHAHI